MILALDIGGSKISAARIEDGGIVERHQVPMRYNEEAFLAAVREVADFGRPPERVAVAATGFLHDGKVFSVNINTIPFWKGFPLEAVLRRQFACPVVMLNDAQAAAWGEYLPRRDRVNNLLFITLSTGVGGGLICDGQLRTGPHGLAGHIGHASVSIPPLDAPVPPCGCGRPDCLEHVASGTALARQAQALLGKPMDSRELFSRIPQDERAAAIVDNAARAVAQAIANCLMLMDVEEAVIGGSVGLAADMIERIRRELDGLPALFRLPVSRAIAGADAGLLGAADWALRAAG